MLETREVSLDNNRVVNEASNNSCSNLIWTDIKKVINTGSLLIAAVGLKTGQRIFQVAVTSSKSFDWNKINPLNNLIDFALTPVQLVVSTQAMNLWKWGAEKSWKKVKLLFSRSNDEELRPLLSSYTEIDVEPGYSCFSKTAIIGKLIMAKMGYWVSNHFMITASSMYSVGSLTSFSEYLTKIIYWPNILSTILRAEVLCYTSILIDKGIQYLTQMHIWSIIKKEYFNCSNNNMNEENEDESLFSVRAKYVELLKVIGYLTAMASATVIDNAIKTAAVMYTANNLSEFMSTFFQVPMFVIMFGLILNDTIGNKVLNKYAKNQFKKCLQFLGCVKTTDELVEVITNSVDVNINDDKNNRFSDKVAVTINDINIDHIVNNNTTNYWSLNC